MAVRTVWLTFVVNRLLSYATESVAHSLGDTLGALLNVSFGNAGKVTRVVYRMKLMPQ